MGVSNIGTRTSGSLGVVKSNAGPLTDETTQLPAEEHNRLIDAVIDAQGAIGLDTDTANPAGSMEARIKSLEAGSGGGGAPSGPAGGALQGTYPDPGIADGAVDALAILDGNVTTAKLDDGAVTAAKLDVNAVTTQAVADGAVTLAKLADINANSLLGNNNALSAGPVVELDPAAVRVLLALPPAVAESIVAGTFDATQESFTSAIEFTSVTDVVTVEVAGSGNAVDGALRWQASDDGLTGWADAGGAFDTYTPGVDFAQVFDHALPKFYRVGFVPNPAGTGTLGYTLTRAGY